MEIKYDCIIVLGGGILSDGTLPLWVTRRLEKARELYMEGKSEHILICGKGKGEPIISEARHMLNFLQESGLPTDSLLFEERSEDTWQNAFFSRTMVVDTHHWKRLLVITSEFHMPRVSAIFSFIYGLEYEIDFKSVSDKGINNKKLEKRKEYERELLDYTDREIFSIMHSGDLPSFREFFFNPDINRYKKYQEYARKLDCKLKTLY